MSKLVDFGSAIQALKAGKRVQRKGWNGKGMFVFMQLENIVSAETVPKMSSLPQSVKDEFKRRIEVGWGGLKFEGGIKYSNQIAIVYPDNNIYSWTPSTSDVFANDWLILD